MAYTRTSDSKVASAPEVTSTPKAGKTSSVSAMAPQAPSAITGAGNLRNFESKQNQASLSGRDKHKSTLSRSPERKTNANSTSYRRCGNIVGSPVWTETTAKAPAPALSSRPSLLQTYDEATKPPSSPKKNHKSVPPLRIQDVPATTDFSRRRRVSRRTSNYVNSSASQEDGCDQSLDSGSDRDFKPEQVICGSDGPGRGEVDQGKHKLIYTQTSGVEGAQELRRCIN
jgi:hypothetical protein